LGLINRGGEHEGHALLARDKAVLLEQRQVDRDRGRHAGFARAPASNGPKLAHAMVGRGTVTGDAVKDLKLGLLERAAERGLQDRKPCAPGVDVTEPGTEQAAAGQGGVNGGHSSPPSASAAALAASLAARSASSSAITSASVGVTSRGWRFK